MKCMTPEVRLRKIKHSLMITARLRRASDRRWRRRFKKHDASMMRVRQMVTSLALAGRKSSCKLQKLRGGNGCPN